MKKVSTLIVLCLAIAAQAVLAGDWTTSREKSRSFIENKSQFDHFNAKAGSKILFGSDETASQVYFTKDGLMWLFVKPERKASVAPDKEQSDLDSREEERVERSYRYITRMYNMQWLNTNPAAEVVAINPTAAHHTYPVASSGAEEEYLTTGGYNKLVYRNLYPNIDVEYIFHPEGGIKYALTLRPGADLSKVKMQWTDVNGGTGKAASASLFDGNVLVNTEFGNLIDHAPVTFYESDKTPIGSAFVVTGNIVSFRLDNYDNSRTVVIDPWQVSPSMPNSNKIWEIEADASGNAYIYGGDMPIKLQKYNSAGVMQWSYNTGYDTANYWVGTLLVDRAGVSYITAGSVARIKKVSTAGAQVWSANGGGLDEYWALSFNCDETQLLAGGTRLVGLFSPTGDGKAYNINMNSGAVLSSVTVAKAIPSFIFNDINEIRSMCFSPNGKFYFHTLDTIGELTNTLGINWRTLTAYRYAYGSPNYGFTPQPQHVIKATSQYIYTMDGATIHRRDINNGSIINSAAIPGGGFATPALVQGIAPRNNGIDIDSCGNVYVGSQTQVHKYDAALNLLASANIPSAAYDVAVSTNGDILVCGQGYASAISSLSACAQRNPVCVTTMSVAATPVNATCNGVCDGSASANPTGGTSPFTYTWMPGNLTGQTVNGLCANTYTVTMTDANSGTATATVTVSQPSPLVANAGPDSSICAGNTYTLTGSGGATYTWSPSVTLNNPNIANPIASPATTTTYTVIVSNGPNCSATDSVKVTVLPGPEIEITPNSDLCLGSSTQLVALAGGATNFSWMPSTGLNNPNIATPLATPTATTTYTVAITASNGCVGTATVTITVHPLPVIVMQDTITTPLPSYTLDPGPGFIAYSWSTGETTQTITVNYPNSGDFCVTVTDANYCTATKCVHVDFTTGIGRQPGAGEVPFVIYPNPNNGQFTIYTGSGIQTAALKIYNVLGEEIYAETLAAASRRQVNLGRERMPAGMYVVQFLTPGAVYTSKLIVE